MKLKEIPQSLFCQYQLSKKNPVKDIPNKRTIPLFVSLTTIPSRLNKVHLTIKSLLDQTVLPEKIFMWLENGLQNDIPGKLKILEGEKFAIKYSKNTSAHRKLLETLAHQKDLPIVTCDDDMMYDPKWLENLYQEHLKYPNSIIGNKVRCIKRDGTRLLSYKQWPFGQNCDSILSTMPVGAWGTLYPPNSLDPLILDWDLALKLAPKNDDLWFKAMSLKHGTISRQSEQITNEPVEIFGSQKVSLKKINVDQDFNKSQWNDLSEYFGFDI